MVVIKDIEMPKGCSDCNFASYHYEFGEYYSFCEFDKDACNKLHERLRNLLPEEGKPKSCPLVEIKEECKKGHWILADEQNKEDVENDNYRFICSECQCSDIHAKGTKVPYCWNCGTNMEVE